jgi:hypothetical protein
MTKDRQSESYLYYFMMFVASVTYLPLTLALTQLTILLADAVPVITSVYLSWSYQ